jgi:hypothetical protein
MTDAELDRVAARLAAARTDVQQARPQRADRALLVDEVVWTVDMMQLLVDDARARIANENTLASVPQSERSAFAGRLASLNDRYRALWLARNRPGGLRDSLTWLDHLYLSYESGEPEMGWGGWPKEYS